MYEHILVEFEETRVVIIDGFSSGYDTGTVIDVDPGTHSVSISGEKNFSPEKQIIDPTGTTELDPLMVNFTRV